MKPRQLFRNLLWLLPVAIILGFSPAAQAQTIQPWSGNCSFTVTTTQRNYKTGLFVKSTKKITGTALMWTEIKEGGWLIPNPSNNQNMMEFWDNSGNLIIAFKQLEVISTKKDALLTKQVLGVGAGEFYYKNQTGDLFTGPAGATITGTMLKDKKGPTGQVSSATITFTVSGGAFDQTIVEPGLAGFVWSGKPVVKFLPLPPI